MIDKISYVNFQTKEKTHLQSVCEHNDLLWDKALGVLICQACGCNITPYEMVERWATGSARIEHYKRKIKEAQLEANLHLEQLSKLKGKKNRNIKNAIGDIDLLIDFVKEMQKYFTYGETVARKATECLLKYNESKFIPTTADKTERSVE